MGREVEIGEGQCWPPSPLSSRRLSCAADGRDYRGRRARTTQRAERRALRGERELGDDSLPTLGQAWLRE